MKKRRVLALLLSVTMVLGMMAGCGKKEDSSTGDVSEKDSAEEPADKDEEGSEENSTNGGEIVKIKIHSPSQEEAGDAEVMAALNEYTREKIGVEVEYVFHGGAYADKIQTIIASGEEYDACFTCNWLNSYNTNVAKGAFIDIKDMLPEVAPTLYETLPDYMWEGPTINGGIYAIPNQQIVARQMGCQMPKEYVDASGAKLEDLTTVPALTDYLQYAYDNYGAKFGGVSVGQAADYCGYEYISDYLSCGAVKMNDGNAKVVNFYETDEWMTMLKDIKALADKGLMDSQCVYDGEYEASQRLIKMESGVFAGTYKPGVEAEAESSYNYPVAYSRPEVEPYITTGSVVATMYGISTTSKHPEETLKYFELLNTDPYVINLLTYGIEGKNYEKVSDNVVKMIPDSGYNMKSGQSWALGNVFNTYALEGQPEDIWEQTKALNDSANASVILGFSFDPEPVKMEITNISKVVKEYESIAGGELPVEETNAELLEKLRVAGVDTVIEEMQRQVDEFLASK